MRSEHLSDDVKRRFYRNYYKSKKKAFTKYATKYADGGKAIEAELEAMKKNATVVRVLAHTQIRKVANWGQKKAHVLEIQVRDRGKVRMASNKHHEPTRCFAASWLCCMPSNPWACTPQITPSRILHAADPISYAGSHACECCSFDVIACPSGKMNDGLHARSVQVNGGSVEEKVDFSYALFEKEVPVDTIFSQNEQIDTIAITRGRGTEGVVTRWGVTRLPRKTHRGLRKVRRISQWQSRSSHWQCARAHSDD